MRATYEGEGAAIRNGLICAFVVAGSIWATYPVAEMGFIDDWSYAKTAQIFAQTGHFVYNGWATAMLGWQIVWGALFIKLFGFSFTAVRLSTLAIAMTTVFLFHAILLRFGINPRNAVLGALTLGLSPLFLPLAASYMTDVTGLFVVILCLYLCQRAIAAGSSKAAIAWLGLAAATNVVGGTARQIAWLGTLVMVPSAGWLLRKRRGVLTATTLLWLISIAITFSCMRWFARQPYSVPEPIFKDPAFSAVPTIEALHLILQVFSAVLCLLLLVFPILIAWLPTARKLSHAVLRRIAWITLGWVFFQWATWTAGWTIPWLLSDVFQYEFAAARTDILLKPEPLALPIWGREGVSLLVIVATLVLVEHLRDRLRPLLKSKTVQQNTWWLLGPFSLSYFILLLPRDYHGILYDRYLLPIMPIAIICLLRMHQEWIAPTLPAVSVAVLGVFALLAMAGTHDWFAFYRARLAAIDEIRASDIPRTAIQGGFEYDGWTQIEAAGYVNEPRIQVPAGAYRPDAHSQLVPDDCKFKLAPFTPAIHPKFTIAFPKMWCLAPSEYPPVNYRTWLPPFKGTVYVQEIPDASN